MFVYYGGTPHTSASSNLEIKLKTRSSPIEPCRLDHLPAIYKIWLQELVRSNVTFNQEYKLEGTLVLLHFIFFDFNFFISVSYFKIILIGRSLKFLSWRHTLPSSDSLVQFQVMKTAIIIAIFLINVNFLVVKC